MQTFLPYVGKSETTYAYYEECAGLLDVKTLGNQRVDNLKIMRALFKGGKHATDPATKMWRGHEWSLLMYQDAICKEWIHNVGLKDTCLDKTAILYFRNADLSATADHSDPPWLHDEAMVLSHQSYLMRKNPDYYRKRFLGVPDDLPIVWPI